MALVGTAAQAFNSTRNLIITFGSITGNGNTQPWNARGFGIGSWQVTGTFGSGTVALQGSNDGVNFYTQGTPASAAGIYGLIGQDAAAAGFNSIVTQYFQFLIAGATSPSLTITVALMSTFG